LILRSDAERQIPRLPSTTRTTRDACARRSWRFAARNDRRGRFRPIRANPLSPKESPAPSGP